MLHLDVCKKQCGKIWHRKPSPTDEGLVLDVTHSQGSPLALQARNIRFLHTAFNVGGESLVAGDHQGNIFLFDLAKNRFTLVQKSGTPCTALAFTLRRRTEFLVALADYSLKCFDTETKEEVAWMKGHSSAVHTISLHASGRYAVSSSTDTAQLWDLDTFERRRKLNIKENVGIVKVFFLPLSNTIVTCFKDDSIFAWESDTLTCKYQLHVPEGSSPNFKAFATTRDGQLLVAGGRSRYLNVWSLDTKKIQRIIELPKKVMCVRQLEFLPNNFDAGSSQVLGVLSQDGILRFIDIATCKQLFDVGSLDNRISNVAISGNGRYVAAVMDNGNLHVFSVKQLSAEVCQPPPPLVKMAKSNKMADTTHDSKHVPGRNQTRGLLRRGRGKDTTGDQTTTHTELPDGLNLDKLMAILKGYGEYPAKYRMFIWRSLLRLPENHAAYGALVDKGVHPSCEKLHEMYPIKSQKLLRVLQRVISALAHWSPIFGETQYLPLMAFPLVKLFQNNQLVCFEILASILTSWCQHWFEYFPNPPINVLGLIENVLAHHDKELLTHLVHHNVTSQTYAWPLLETLFSEVLTRDEWLKLMDNVFSNHPCFLLMVVVAYCLKNRGPLLKCSELDDFKFFFHHRNAVDVVQVVQEAYRLMDITPADLHPQQTVEEFEPLTKGQYPVFNKYPKFIVDYQVQERERIRQEELEYLRQRQVSMELQQETQRKQTEEEAWYRQQQLLQEAEDKRRRLIVDEEQKLGDQRSRLTAMNRELKMKELQLLEATRRKFRYFQQQQKEMELTRLDDEIRRKAEMREVETQAAVEEADVKNMELRLQRKLLEQDLFRSHTEAEQKVKADYDTRRKQNEMEDRVTHFMTNAERDKEQSLRKTLQQNLASADQLRSTATLRNEVEARQQLEGLEREEQARRLAEVRQGSRAIEQQVHGLMRTVERQTLRDVDERNDALVDQRRLVEDAEARRLRLLEAEVDDARRHVDTLDHTQDRMFDHLNDMQQDLVDIRRGARDDGLVGDRHDKYINDSESEVSVQFSLDRGRQGFEARERELMADVRKMRQRLAQDSRNKRPPPAYMEA